MPTLTLLALSDSFAAIWPDLASEVGLDLSPVGEPAGMAGVRESIGLICGAGVEPTMESAFRLIAGTGLEIAAVGSIADHRLAVSLMRAGAAEYFALPQDYQLLCSWLRERAERLEVRVHRTAFADSEGAKYRFEGILGQSAALQEALDRAARVIPHANVTVLITGETGTGKELIARAIHYNGPRRELPFVDVNCAAIPENLLESELFGHEKGAFTGATSAKPGLFEVADGGTIFLDEIGHLSPALQGKLLRVLQERSIRRVGGTRNKTVDVRVLAATHVDLAVATVRGEFRDDLYHRLNVVPIHLPPLRERAGDVLLLARRFISAFAAEYGTTEPFLTPAGEAALQSHPWTGNIRELRNLIERAILLGGGAAIDPELLDLPPSPTEAATTPASSSLRHVVHEVVVTAVERSGGNKSEAARQLRISRTRLQRLLDVDPDHPSSMDEEP